MYRLTTIYILSEKNFTLNIFIGKELLPESQADFVGLNIGFLANTQTFFTVLTAKDIFLVIKPFGSNKFCTRWIYVLYSLDARETLDS